MSTKVLVFESDPAFAGELRTELGKLGCNTTVVEDGNVGLQQAGSDKPDLILLSIELPRMNGFSVCNKLKKDAGLKDVPLIIMSSESSDETFEQHKKLRTRAEDYVHKPIAFGELLRHIQGFVPIGTDVGSESESIVIEEDIESADYLVEEDAAPATAGGSEKEPPKSNVDADVEAFAEDAFGRLTEAEAPPPPAAARAGHNGATESRAPKKSVAPAAARPAPAGVDPVEHERVAGELARTKERLAQTEHAEAELADAKREIDKLRMDAGEAEQLAREVEELKTKIASGAKGGAVSSREFLDLREGLNRKDKEILSLREGLSKKDKEIVETQEKMLALERSKADLDDRLLAVERELDESREKSQAQAGEAERAKKAGDEIKARLDKSVAEGEAKDRSLAELKSKGAADVSALEGKLAAARAEYDQTLANERAERGRAGDEAEERRKADLDQARRDQEAAVSESSERAARDQKAALEAQATQLSKEHSGKLDELRSTHEQDVASARAAHQKELDTARAEGAEALRAADERREAEVSRARKEAEDKLAQARKEAEDTTTQALEDATNRAETSLAALRSEHTDKVSALENDRDARIATLESKATRELGEANDKLAKIEVDFSGVRGELESLRETKRNDDATFAAKTAGLEALVADASRMRTELEIKLAEKTDKLATETSRADRAQSKWEADRQSLDRAKDALAVALSQIEEAEGRAP